MQRLIVGCGYLGQQVARLWHAQGDQVWALTRLSERAEDLRAMGLNPLQGDLLKPELLPAFPSVETLLFAVGYDKQSGKEIGEVYVQGLANILAVLPESVRRVVYISSTGVYGGGTDGEFVDESSLPLPDRAGARAAWQAEEVLRQSRFAGRSIVLRLAGIYGPGRTPRIDEVRQGNPLAADPDSWLNLIHVADAAAIVCLAAERAVPPALYNVSDGNPVRRGDYFDFIFKLLGASGPRYSGPRASGGERSRGGNKRVKNDKLVQELAPKFRFPNYQAGLADALANQS